MKAEGSTDTEETYEMTTYKWHPINITIQIIILTQTCSDSWRMTMKTCLWPTDMWIKWGLTGLTPLRGRIQSDRCRFSVNSFNYYSAGSERKACRADHVLKFCAVNRYQHIWPLSGLEHLSVLSTSFDLKGLGWFRSFTRRQKSTAVYTQ